ncbi:MAG: ankyrin repeat domain-containing protein [Akkermansiaceae bacterium]
MLVVCVFISACQESDNAPDRGASGQALLEAVQIGDNRTVAKLLAEGAYTEVRSKSGDTPLLYAVRTGNVQCARMLLNYDLNKDARSGTGKGPLELAIDSGNQKMFVCLIKGGIPPDEIGHDGNPLLFKAVKFKDLETMALLLENGADVSAEGKEGRTALHVATENGLKECVVALVRAGSDVNTRDDNGVTPLWLAMHLSGSHDRAEMLKQLFTAGADPSVPVKNDKHLLAEAVKRGMLKESVELINYGADVNSSVDEVGNLADVAYKRKDNVMLAMLLSRGTDGSRLLERVIENEDTETLRLLFDHGYSLAAWQGSQSDSLIAACVRESKESLADLLLRHGANPEGLGREKQRPLHMAVAMRNVEMVRLLLEHGADPNVYFARPASKDFLKLTEKESMQWFLKNERRLSPLMMAANNGDVSIIASLLDHGAKKYVYSGKHRLYPVNFASRRADVKSMQVILGQDPENEKMHAVLDLSEQRVRLYNAKGEVVYSSRVSTGKRGFRTPTGVFVITDKHRSHRSTIYGSSMPFFQRLSCSAFGFHSGNCPGYPASHGCIRMPYSAAKKLFSLTPVGTRVVIQK